MVDLTQRIGAEPVTWPGRPAPAFETVESHDRDGAFSRIASLFEHTGTHLDAPAHFIRGAPAVDQIPAEHLICPLAVVDVAARVAADPDYRLSVSDLEHDQFVHGPIRPNSVVAIRTGWGQRCADEALYLGRTRDGLLHFPGVGREAAQWLTSRRQIRGTDTAGMDSGVDASFEVHAKVTLPQGVWHLEGLVNLELLPARGAIIFVGAIPLAEGSGAPARVLAVISAPMGGLMSIRPVYRITVFVPPEHLDSLLEGVEREVSLVFGPYDRSAWWSAAGVEQFRPLPGSNPTVGQTGQVERVPTVRVEFAIPRDWDLLATVLAHGVIANHPWEEPAVFVDEALATASQMITPPDLAAP